MLRLINKMLRRYGYALVMHASCRHCGGAIQRQVNSSTGYTHVIGSKWEGIRCPSRLVGATPGAFRP